MTESWLTVRRGEASLIVSLPHAGLKLPSDCTAGLVSADLAHHDSDWSADGLHVFAHDFGATTVRTTLSRTVIDVNRDPSGSSLHPGQATTGLAPTETFDGRPLYRDGAVPTPEEIKRRKMFYFAPYHAALAQELARLRGLHKRAALYDSHSIRSAIPRLFPGELPVFNMGADDGKGCDSALTERIAGICAASRRSHRVDGRFKGGWITRACGRPADGVHAAQMELGMRGCLPDESDPPRWDNDFAKPIQQTLQAVFEARLTFARA